MSEFATFMPFSIMCFAGLIMITYVSVHITTWLIKLMVQITDKVLLSGLAGTVTFLLLWGGSLAIWITGLLALRESTVAWVLYLLAGTSVVLCFIYLLASQVPSSNPSPQK